MIGLLRLGERVLAVAAGLALLAMMVLTFVDVFGRYGFHASVFGGSEMVELLMVVVIFAGVALVTLDDDHIAVNVIDHLLPAAAGPAMRWVRGIFSLVCYAGVAVALGLIARDAWVTGKTSIVLQMPQWWAATAATVLTAAGAAVYGLALLLTGGAPRRLAGMHQPSDLPDHAGGGL